MANKEEKMASTKIDSDESRRAVQMPGMVLKALNTSQRESLRHRS